MLSCLVSRVSPLDYVYLYALVDFWTCWLLHAHGNCSMTSGKAHDDDMAGPRHLCSPS